MTPFQWAFLFDARLSLCVIGIQVARVAEVSVSKAEENCRVTAELTLELNEIIAMLLTILESILISQVLAMLTDKVLWVRLVIQVSHAVSMASIDVFFALETFEELKFKHSEALQIIIELVFRV